MSQIYRYELFSRGMDFNNGFGFTICQTGIHQWFDVPKGVLQIDLLVSTEEFEESIPAHFIEGSTSNWRLMKKDGIGEHTVFYQRTSDMLREVSNKKIYIGVEYDESQ